MARLWTIARPGYVTAADRLAAECARAGAWLSDLHSPDASAGIKPTLPCQRKTETKKS